MKHPIQCSAVLASVGRLKPVCRKSFLLLAIFLATVPSLAATADGFVTKIDSATAFEMGVWHVVLSPTTRCEAVTLPAFKRAAGSWTGKLYYPSSAYSESMRHSSLPCRSLRLGGGSHVHLVGNVQADRQFVTARIVLVLQDSRQVLTSGAVLEEAPKVWPSTQGWNGILWLDGYPLSVTPQTDFLAAPATTVLRYWIPLRTLILYITHSHLHHTSTVPHFSADLLRENTCSTYHAMRLADGSLNASQLRLGPNQVESKEEKYLNKYAAVIRPPNYARGIPGGITFKPMYLSRTKTVEIIPAIQLQEWVSKLGTNMVPQYQRNLPDANLTKVDFHFYVVHNFGSTLNAYLGLINVGGPDYMNVVVAMPNGIILVPDTTLASLDNKAQVATLLSYAITSVLQKQSYIAWPYVMAARAGEGQRVYTHSFLLWQTEQKLRIGIRQMYLAGYDIREAPFAWAVAQGEPVSNPVINSKHPDKEIPWYAAYAFNYISQYYKDVDYSKLKRGRREYQQFLQELYKADPSLPQPKAKE